MATPVLCLSPIAWPQCWGRLFHVLTHLAASRRVYVLEPPVTPCRLPLLGAARSGGVTVLTPYLPAGTPPEAADRLTAPLLDAVLDGDGVTAPLLWVADPERLRAAAGVTPRATVYDCAASGPRFHGSPAEAGLLRRADVVFAASAADAARLRRRHPQVHHVPDCADVDHFARAREAHPEPPELAAIPRPRLGLIGPLDGRVDGAVLSALAEAHPEWQVVSIGPIRRGWSRPWPLAPSFHALGPRPYPELPRYLAGCDVFIAPCHDAAAGGTLPPLIRELLAAGRPVVTTAAALPPDCDPAGGALLAADGPDAFLAAVAEALRAPRAVPPPRRFAAPTSWASTVRAMLRLIDADSDRGEDAGMAGERDYRVIPGGLPDLVRRWRHEGL